MDIVYVTYNSENWIQKCFSSYKNNYYDLKKVNIYVVDNNSNDNTIKELQMVKNSIGSLFSSFEIIESSKNLGFGRGNNLGFRNGNSEIVCFFNIDTEILPDTLTALDAEISASEADFAMWELRQFPYEHPKLYNPITGETTWSSGAAFAMRRQLYAELGGFDEQIFMYAEDVDLSWRLRSFGYKIKYCPKSTIIHYSYESAGVIKPNQHVFGVINNLLLRYRFGTIKDIMVGHALFWNLMRRPAAFEHSKKMLLKQYFMHFFKISHFHSRKSKGNDKEFKPFFSAFDYSPIKDGAFYENKVMDERNLPKVSIIVRTCNRPCVLKETLMSLRRQTYKNLEIVVVEDGKPTAANMIKKEFSDLNIVYHSTGKNVGRSRAGNLAMEMATGKYLNFLDDDDLFYADHVEILVNTLLNCNDKAAYATSFETPIEVFSKEPYKYEVKNYLGIHKQKFDKIMLCHHNYIPIQCIMFEKSLFENYGGLDESLDALEDWDLWVKYSLHTDFAFILKTTSVYRVPYNKKVNSTRQKALDEALIKVRDKHKGYLQKISVYDMAMMYEKAGY